MFRENISRPIDPIPVEYVNSLNRLENEPDYSLACLGIALLKSRIENYNGISGVYYNFTDRENCIEDFKIRIKDCNKPLLCYYTYTNDKPSDLDKIKELTDFAIKETISKFVEGKTDNHCIAIYHKKENIAAVFINTRDLRLYHLLLAPLSLYFPNLFKDKPMTEEDYDIVKTLSKTDKSDFFAAVKKSVAKYTVEFRMKQLTTLMQQMHTVKINQAFDKQENIRRTLNDLERQMGQLVIELREAIVTYEGLKATESYDEPEKELVDYIANNPDIHGLKIDNGKIYFSVSTLLNNYNSDAWEVFSRRGSIYDGDYSRVLLDAFKNQTNRKLLLDNIFSEDPVFSIKVCGNYILDLNECRVATSSSYNYEDVDPMFKSYLRNPHLHLHNCLGGYKERINPMLRERNYISAIETCIASAGSVNLDETSMTFRPFIGFLLSSKEKVLRMKDGTEMTPEEALVWLTDKEKSE